MPRRTIVYVDGFNLCYGALKGGADKWLDLLKYFTRLRQADVIETVYFFTVIVSGDGSRKQLEYLRALATSPRVRVVMGKFKDKEVSCRVVSCCHPAARTFRVPAEKRTDVNIALQMLEDAYEDRCDNFVLVSGDSDLVPAIHRVRSRFPNKRVVVYVPARDPSRSAAVELRSAATDARDLPLNLLRFCQFPPTMPDGNGRVIAKPDSW